MNHLGVAFDKLNTGAFSGLYGIDSITFCFIETRSLWPTFAAAE